MRYKVEDIILKKKFTGKVLIIGLLCLVFFSIPSTLSPIPCVFGSFEDDSSGARMRGMAGVFGAIADDSEAVLSQPAGLATLWQMDASVSYGRLFTGLSDSSEIADSIVTIGFPVARKAGAGLAYKSIALNSIYREQTMAGSFAYRLLPKVSVGTTLKYLSLSFGADEYTRIDPVLSAQSSKSAMDADAGILIMLPGGLRFSLARQNIMGADLGIAEPAATSARDRAGIAYRENTFLMSAEYVKELASNHFGAGMEKILARGLLALRLGIGVGSNDYRKVTAGLRVNFRQFSMDYAFDFPLGGIDKTMGTHYLSLVFRGGGPGRWDKKKEALIKKLPMELPGMNNASTQAPVVIESSAMICAPALPQVQKPAPVGTLRAMLYSSVDFEVMIASTTDRIGEIIRTSTNTVIAEPPHEVPHAKKTKQTPKIKEKIVLQEASEASQPVVARPASPSSSADNPVATPADLPRRQAGGPSSGVRTHRVESGDTLPMIAERYYGRQSDWNKIYEANKDRIRKGTLEKGQVLLIP